MTDTSVVMIEKDFTFDAAHCLVRVPKGHKCGRMHGHTYTISVAAKGTVDPVSGWVMDFGDLGDAVKPLIRELDHTTLNDVDGLSNPTSEALAQWLADRLLDQIPGLSRVIVSETGASRCVLTL